MNPAGIGIRAAHPNDASAILGMHRRCSLDSLARPYFTGAPSEKWISGVLADADARSLPAVVSDGPDVDRVVGIANHVRCGLGAAEMALLVEDAYQRRGIGSGLARQMACAARRSRIERVSANIGSGNVAALKVFERVVCALTRSRRGPLLRIEGRV